MNFPDIPRYPARLGEKEFYPTAYYYMYFSRSLETRFIELFKKGHVKGTVIISMGGEATAAGMGMPFRPGKDVLSLLHRDMIAHIMQGMSPRSVICQYMANAESPTHGREGNVHYGDASVRRFPMISHLGNMLAPAVGGTWAARQNGEDAFGLAVIGDGGSSTGDFHESLNLASVRKSPVLFLIENNHLAYSTPVGLQYNCANLADRAAGYGIPGVTVDGTDVWEVYQAVLTAMDTMHETSLPYIIESDCVRLMGHAVYDNAEYVTQQQRNEWRKRDPLPKTRQCLARLSGYSDSDILELERQIDQYLDALVRECLGVCRPSPAHPPWDTFAPAIIHKIEPFKAQKVKNGTAVVHALDYILSHNPESVLFGQDIGVYGSAFKTCKGLFEKHGPQRVVDMPICESAMVGFSLGASQAGSKPIIEFQFADFATEAVTQLGLNSASWFFRSGLPAPMLLRLPCGAGITLGAFHSGEYEGLWSRFPGLKLFYPATPQETFEALVAGYYDPNPCLVFEHKLLYWTKGGDIDFDGNLDAIYRPRKYADGTELTIVALGAMIDISLKAAQTVGCSSEVWNPYILKPSVLEPVVESVRRTGRLLVVQENNRVAGLGDHIVSVITENCFSEMKSAPRVVAASENPVPFARELEQHHIPGVDVIVRAIHSTMEMRT